MRKQWIKAELDWRNLYNHDANKVMSAYYQTKVQDLDENNVYWHTMLTFVLQDSGDEQSSFIAAVMVSERIKELLSSSSG